MLSKLIDLDETKWRLYLSPFQWQVWACLAASVPFTAIVIYLFKKASPCYSSEEKKEGFGKFDLAVLNTYGSLFTQGEDEEL